MFYSKVKSCKMSFGNYTESLDIDISFNNLKGHSWRVGFAIIPSGGFVLNIGLTKR